MHALTFIQIKVCILPRNEIATTELCIVIIKISNYEYTGYFILIAPGKYLEKYGNYEKMFRTKVVWFRGGHKIVTLV